jgi:hypothetical protein
LINNLVDGSIRSYKEWSLPSPHPHPPHIFLEDLKTLTISQKKVIYVKTNSKEPKKLFDVKNSHKSFRIYFFSILNHGDHGKLLFCDTYECQ